MWEVLQKEGLGMREAVCHISAKVELGAFEGDLTVKVFSSLIKGLFQFDFTPFQLVGMRDFWRRKFNPKDSLRNSAKPSQPSYFLLCQPVKLCSNNLNGGSRSHSCCQHIPQKQWNQLVVQLSVISFYFSTFFLLIDSKCNQTLKQAFIQYLIITRDALKS